MAIHDDRNKARMQETWFRDSLTATDLQWLQDVNYGILDRDLLYTFVERWHKEMFSFHLLMG